MTNAPDLSAREALYTEMARQMRDSKDTLDIAASEAQTVATSLKETGSLLLLGMGASHAVGRAVEPLYRSMGIDAIALPLSEQLTNPLPIEERTILISSQSGESAEVLRWFREGEPEGNVFGLTMEPSSSLAQLAPCLVGAGGSEKPFAATRSLTVTVALHAAILQALGMEIDTLLEVMEPQDLPSLEPTIDALNKVTSIVTSGRHLQGVAEAIALGLTELSRIPCFSLEGGQLRHGPMEMLSESVGVVMFRAADESCDLVTSLANAVAKSDAPLILFDASDKEPINGAVTVPCRQASGLAAIFSLLPAAQRFMIDFAATRVEEVGVPVRSSKVTRVE